MKYLILTIATLIALSGCSAKEINNTTDGIMNDVSNAFENSKDNS